MTGVIRPPIRGTTTASPPETLGPERASEFRQTLLGGAFNEDAVVGPPGQGHRWPRVRRYNQPDTPMTRRAVKMSSWSFRPASSAGVTIVACSCIQRVCFLCDARPGDSGTWRREIAR